MKPFSLGLLSVSSLMLMTASGSALAAFNSDLTVTGAVEFRTADQRPWSDGNVNQTGEIRKKVGGATTSSGFTTTPGAADGNNDNTTVPSSTTATNPLTGTLTDIGDGVGWGTTTVNASYQAGILSPNVTDGYDFIVDFLFNLENTSLTDTLTVTLKTNYRNVADADGGDAFAEGDLEVERSNVDLFTSNVMSDTLLGDSLNGVSQGTSGAEISDIGMFFYDVVLVPGETATVDGFHRWRGGVFDDPGSSVVDIGVDITVDSIACSGECIVAPVPVPGAVWLFGTGLSGLAFLGFRRRRTTRRAA